MNVSIDPRTIEPERLRPLRRSEFQRLAATGAFDEERVELLFGQLVAMSPPDPSHDESVTQLGESVEARMGRKRSDAHAYASSMRGLGGSMCSTYSRTSFAWG